MYSVTFMEWKTAFQIPGMTYKYSSVLKILTNTWLRTENKPLMIYMYYLNCYLLLSQHPDKTQSSYHSENLSVYSRFTSFSQRVNSPGRTGWSLNKSICRVETYVLTFNGVSKVKGSRDYPHAHSRAAKRSGLFHLIALGKKVSRTPWVCLMKIPCKMTHKPNTRVTTEM